ncbi:MAG TPA: carbohydrate ABC transporter permease [Thermoflexus sp.]|nr:carbohydrate ABC transporter permease [Thermoflexus sp.]
MWGRAKGAFPYLVLFALSIPLLLLYAWLFIGAFSTQTRGLTPMGFTLENWRFLVRPWGGRPSIWVAALNSALLAGGYTLILLFISSTAAYALSRLSFRGRRFFLMLVLVLHAFPSITLLIAIFYVLRALRLYDTLIGVALVKTALELPLGIWVMKGFFDNVPWDVEMAALIDGCSRFQAWRRVMLPLVRPGIAALAVFAFILGWNEFLLPYIYMPSLRNWTLSVYIRSVTAGGAGEILFVNYGVIAAVGLFYVLPVLLFFVLTQRYLLQIYAGGVKG